MALKAVYGKALEVVPALSSAIILTPLYPEAMVEENFLGR